MSKIVKQKDGKLLVPDTPTVPYITGDGVGAEITPAMQLIVNAAVEKVYGGKRKLTGWRYWPAKRLLTKPVHGCPTKRCWPLKNTW